MAATQLLTHGQLSAHSVSFASEDADSLVPTLPPNFGILLVKIRRILL